MATRVKKKVNWGAGRPTQFPWSTWTDGSTWKAIQGKDFQISCAQFRQRLMNKSYSIGLKVRTLIHDNKTVLFQFYNPSTKQKT